MENDIATRHLERIGPPCVKGYILYVEFYIIFQPRTIREYSPFGGKADVACFPFFTSRPPIKRKRYV